MVNGVEGVKNERGRRGKNRDGTQRRKQHSLLGEKGDWNEQANPDEYMVVMRGRQ